MPNRMLRPWINSEKVNSLTVHAERFFTRLIMVVDDYGCFYADTRLLKANLFPLLIDSIREADLLRWVAECETAGLIVLYESSSKRYLQINDFKQRLDRAKSKYPQFAGVDREVVNECREVVNDYPPEEKRSRTEPEVEVEPVTRTKKESIGSLKLSQVQIGSAIEYLKFTKQKTLLPESIDSLWKFFLVKEYPPGKFYKSEADIYSHFMNSLKFEKLENIEATNKNISNDRQKRERERLEEISGSSAVR